MPSSSEFQSKLQAIEKAIEQIDSGADPHLRSIAKELIQLVMELHGTALARILEMLHASGEAGQDAIERLGFDDLVSSLLILHGLHPTSVEDRAISALDKIKPSLQKRGAKIEVLQFIEGALTLKLQADRHAASLKELVEEAIYQAAPDISSLVIEIPEERQGFVPLEILRGTRAASGKGAL